MRFLTALAALLSLAAPAARAVDEADLLPVDEAFVLTTEAASRDTISLRWKIADGYYLYRERISATAVEPGFADGALDLPPGTPKKDEFFGDVQIYRGEVTATFTGVPTDDLASVTLRVKSQGCADVGVCYPPNAVQVVVDLPPPGAAARTPDAGASPTASPFGAAAPFASSTPLASSAPFGGSPAAAAVDEAPLPPEQAFVFEAIPTAPDRILARFTPAKNYYLYRDKTTFALEGTDETLGAPQWPPGVSHTDEHFGDVVVYFDQVEVPIDVQRGDEGARTLRLTASFQGCQLDGICYPPMTRTVSVELPAGPDSAARASGTASAPPATGAAAGTIAPQSEQDRLASALAGPNRFMTLLAFFGFGLLLAFTPCVFPMIPILSGIIAGAGDIGARRAFVLSFVYVLASAVVFTIAGVVAGLAGQNLQAAFQNPWVLWSFALMFVALAFSMFGYYELQLPASLQTRLAGISNSQKSGSLTGVAIMGALSALIVGPCVAPPLAAAVIYIAERRDPIMGGLALFSLAMGMGAPLLLFGTGAGRFMPRAGAWMDAVKRVFGVIFLLLAVWMLERILAPAWIMWMVAAIAIGSAVFLRALDRLPDAATGMQRIGKAIGVVLLVVGVAQVIGALSGAKDVYQPLKGIGGGAGAEARLLEFTPIKSTGDVDAALAAARASGKPVLLDFYADWCVACKEMEKYTFPEPDVQRAFAPYVRLKADVTANDDVDQALMKRYGIIGPPATLFFPGGGDERRDLRLVGFEEADAFARRLDDGAR